MSVLKTYSILEPIMKCLDTSKLHTYIDGSSAVTAFQGLHRGPNCLEVVGDTLVDESALDALVDDAVLDVWKAMRIEGIDKRTKELIAQGFVYDGATFSLSKEAQGNWTDLEAHKALITWPKAITTLDDDEYSLAEADLGDFRDAEINAKFGHVDSGRDLKIDIKAATTQAELDAVVDNR